MLSVGDGGGPAGGHDGDDGLDGILILEVLALDQVARRGVNQRQLLLRGECVRRQSLRPFDVCCVTSCGQPAVAPLLSCNQAVRGSVCIREAVCGSNGSIQNHWTAKMKHTLAHQPAPHQLSKRATLVCRQAYCPVEAMKRTDITMRVK
jgi:hypothetical protein